MAAVIDSLMSRARSSRKSSPDRPDTLQSTNPILAMNRRTFLKNATAGTAALACAPRGWTAQIDLDRIRKEVETRHDESVRRLQEWIHQPSIAAENRGFSEGCDLAIRLLREAGFDRAIRVQPMANPGFSP